ncbi:MAG: hypothetical protein LBB05_00165 [Puniceicoccales bacterium]|jgi:hypothetical protein|nr:hypothetical protein [Puniceicoccales bacterium]
MSLRGISNQPSNPISTDNRPQNVMYANKYEIHSVSVEMQRNGKGKIKVTETIIRSGKPLTSRDAHKSSPKEFKDHKSAMKWLKKHNGESAVVKKEYKSKDEVNAWIKKRKDEIEGQLIHDCSCTPEQQKRIEEYAQDALAREEKPETVFEECKNRENFFYIRNELENDENFKGCTEAQKELIFKKVNAAIRGKKELGVILEAGKKNASYDVIFNKLEKYENFKNCPKEYQDFIREYAVIKIKEGKDSNEVFKECDALANVNKTLDSVSFKKCTPKQQQMISYMISRAVSDGKAMADVLNECKENIRKFKAINIVGNMQEDKNFNECTDGQQKAIVAYVFEAVNAGTKSEVILEACKKKAGLHIINNRLEKDDEFKKCEKIQKDFICQYAKSKVEKGSNPDAILEGCKVLAGMNKNLTDVGFGNCTEQQEIIRQYAKDQLASGKDPGIILNECKKMVSIYKKLKKNEDFKQCTPGQKEAIDKYIRNNVADIRNNVADINKKCKDIAKVCIKLKGNGKFNQCTLEQQKAVCEHVQSRIAKGGNDIIQLGNVDTKLILDECNQMMEIYDYMKMKNGEDCTSEQLLSICKYAQGELKSRNRKWTVSKKCNQMVRFYGKLNKNEDFKQCTPEQKEFIGKFAQSQIAAGKDQKTILEACNQMVPFYMFHNELESSKDFNKCTDDQRKAIVKYGESEVGKGVNTADVLKKCEKTAQFCVIRNELIKNEHFASCASVVEKHINAGIASRKDSDTILKECKKMVSIYASFKTSRDFANHKFEELRDRSSAYISNRIESGAEINTLLKEYKKMASIYAELEKDEYFVKCGPEQRKAIGEYVREMVKGKKKTEIILNRCGQMMSICDKLSKKGDFNKCKPEQREAIYRFARDRIKNEKNEEIIAKECKKMASIYVKLEKNKHFVECEPGQKEAIEKYIQTMITAEKDTKYILDGCKAMMSVWGELSKNDNFDKCKPEQKEVIEKYIQKMIKNAENTECIFYGCEFMIGIYNKLNDYEEFDKCDPEQKEAIYKLARDMIVKSTFIVVDKDVVYKESYMATFWGGCMTMTLVFNELNKNAEFKGCPPEQKAAICSIAQEMIIESKEKNDILEACKAKISKAVEPT